MENNIHALDHPAHPDANVPDQTENVTNSPSHSNSPRRTSTENEDVASPLLPVQHLNGRRASSSDENSETDDRSIGQNDINVDSGDSEPQNSFPIDNESTFSCKYPGCNFTAVDAEVYLKHEDSHVDGGSVTCDICNVSFPTYASMRRHHLYIHQGIRTFNCHLCAKRFLRKEQYMEHLIGHSWPRPHQCNLCGESFSYRGQLKSHRSNEHANVFDKSCHLCDFKASSPGAVKLHYVTFHLKQNVEMLNNRPFDLIHQVHMNPTDNGALDLAAVAQNFSIVPGHFPYYSSIASDGSVPGPSDLSRTSNVIISSNLTNSHALVAQTINPNTGVPNQEEDNRHINSLTSNNADVNPDPNTSGSRPQVQNPIREKVIIKPEPPELVIDDSQNSNVQPTSTMDLTTTDVVGTTCSADEAGTSDGPCRRRSHKHSTDDTGSESQYSPTNRRYSDSHPKNAHTCYRFRPYEDTGSQRCREYVRHTCGNLRHMCDRHNRFLEADSDRNSQNEHSDERKVFYSRATSTNVQSSGETHYANVTAAGDHSAEPHAESDIYNRKSTIVIRDIESCTLTCMYCGIIFPDQTLYLLHRSLHSESNPWKCNLCGKMCKDKYDFNSHVISKGHY